MLEKLLTKMNYFLNTLDIDAERKRKIIEIFIENMDIKEKNLSDKEKNDKTFLELYFQNYFTVYVEKVRSACLIEENVDEYISFIRKNKYNFNPKILSKKDEKLYNLIVNTTFDFETILLKTDGVNSNVLIHRLFWLATRLGFTENKKNYNTDCEYKYSDIPDDLKDAIKGVEK